jgi:hypothetical protein
LWQRVLTDGGHHEVRGRYLSAPDCRLRLELEVQVGKTRAAVLLVADGRRLWQRQVVGRDEPAVSQVELPVPPKDCADPAAFASGRERALHEQSFGVSALLGLLRGGGQGWQGKRAKWQGAEVLLLSAAWPPAAPMRLPPVDGLRPPPQAKRVCVFLDPQSLWPRRVEWWGETAEGDAVTLAELEFRAPVRNQPLSATECRREFTFP